MVPKSGESYSTGPPAITEYSIAPQFCHPVTRTSNRAARMYAKPAYSVSITRIFLALCLRPSFRAADLEIFAVSVESVFSKDAASSPDWNVVSQSNKQLVVQPHLEGPQVDHGVCARN